MEDTRTEAERRYDATRLSPLPTASAPAELPTVRETPDARLLAAVE